MFGFFCSTSECLLFTVLFFFFDGIMLKIYLCYLKDVFLFRSSGIKREGTYQWTLKTEGKDSTADCKYWIWNEPAVGVKAVAAALCVFMTLIVLR